MSNKWGEGGVKISRGSENVQFCRLKQHSKMLHSKRIQTIEVNKEKNVRKYTRLKQHILSKETFSSKFELFFSKINKQGSPSKGVLGWKEKVRINKQWGGGLLGTWEYILCLSSTPYCLPIRKWRFISKMVATQLFGYFVSYFELLKSIYHFISCNIRNS